MNSAFLKVLALYKSFKSFKVVPTILPHTLTIPCSLFLFSTLSDPYQHTTEKVMTDSIQQDKNQRCCVEMCSEWVWGVFYFKPAVELIQIVCQLLILHIWGVVFCCWLSLSDLSTLMLCHWNRIRSLAYRNNSSLPLWSPFSMYIWPVYIRYYPPPCKDLLWPDGAVWVLQWTIVVVVVD